MLDHNELSKYFTESQMQDVIQLYEADLLSPIKRIRRKRVRAIKPGHIPRPVNSFISFRTEKQAIIRNFCPTANHREISKITAKWWRLADPDEKETFFKKAAIAKAEHSEKYPDYIFSPKLKAPRKSRKPITKKPKSIAHTSTDSLTPPSVKLCHETADVYENQVIFGDKEIYNNEIIHSDLPQSWTCETHSQMSFHSSYYSGILSSDPAGYGNANPVFNLDYEPYGEYYCQPSLLCQPYSFNHIMGNLALYNFETNMMKSDMFSPDLETTPHSQLLNTPSLKYANSPLSLYCQQGWCIDGSCNMLATPDNMINTDFETKDNPRECVFAEQLIQPFDEGNFSGKFSFHTLDDSVSGSLLD